MIRDLDSELVLFITKATGNAIPKGYIRKVNQIHDKNEIAVLNAVRRIVKRGRTRFLNKFTLSKLPKLEDCKQIKKSTDDDSDNNSIQQQLRDMMESVFAGASEELVEELNQHIADIAKNFSSAYDVKVNYKLVNDRAIDYLENNVNNYFSTLSDSQASGIEDSVAKAMADKAGYDLGSIVDGIRSTFMSGNMMFPDSKLDLDSWMTMVARTTTATAASVATKATIQSLGLSKIQWYCNDDPCDICEDNDNEIIDTDDTFTSGDDSPPAHPLCRCVIVAVRADMDGSDLETNSDSDDNAEEDE